MCRWGGVTHPDLIATVDDSDPSIYVLVVAAVQFNFFFNDCDLFVCGLRPVRDITKWYCLFLNRLHLSQIALPCSLLCKYWTLRPVSAVPFNYLLQNTVLNVSSLHQTLKSKNLIVSGIILYCL